MPRVFKGKCLIEGCVSPVVARGWCGRHWQRWRKHGDPLVSKAYPLWDGRCLNCGAQDPYPATRLCRECNTAKTKANRAKNLERSRATNLRWAKKDYHDRRQRVLKHYGPNCACCGEERQVFLAIDHIGGGGNAHRRSLSPTGKMVTTGRVYKWLELNGFPKGFRVLCHNCNYAEAHGGVARTNLRVQNDSWPGFGDDGA